MFYYFFEIINFFFTSHSKITPPATTPEISASTSVASAFLSVVTHNWSNSVKSPNKTEKTLKTYKPFLLPNHCGI